jgi:hypothetical protein
MPSPYASEFETSAGAFQEDTSTAGTNERSDILAAMRKAMTGGVIPGTQLGPSSTHKLVRKYILHKIFFRIFLLSNVNHFCNGIYISFDIFYLNLSPLCMHNHVFIVTTCGLHELPISSIHILDIFDC